MKKIKFQCGFENVCIFAKGSCVRFDKDSCIYFDYYSKKKGSVYKL